ncbi:uncharacterized protein TNCV_391721 [Trichonephila clavipes]|nr:uncharacterized protein TNCV_391721 [Trichonephila clavipes]
MLDLLSLKCLNDGLQRAQNPIIFNHILSTQEASKECLLKLVKRFEETGKLEDRARARRPCLKEARAPCIAVEMEAIASEAASGISSAREAARRLGLPPSSVRNILRRILQLYPYKLQSRH